MSVSKRHHYLPEFYQKGFTSAQGTFKVYDKKTKRLSNKDRTPSSIFFEWNLNSALLQRGLEHHFEPVLSAMDSKWSKVIQVLREKPIQEAVDALDPYRSAHLLHFAIMLLWRHPKAGNEFLDAFDRLGARSNYVDIERFGPITQIPEADLTRGFRRFFTEPEWQKFAKFSVPFSTGVAEDIGQQGAWTRIYQIDNPHWNFLLGDRPVIINQSGASTNLLYEAYLFPLSAKRLVVIAEDTPDFIDSNISELINMNIFHQADRYVCSPCEAVLRKAVDQYDRWIGKGIALEHLNDILFQNIQWRSKFKDYASFLQAFQEKYSVCESPA